MTVPSLTTIENPSLNEEETSFLNTLSDLVTPYLTHQNIAIMISSIVIVSLLWYFFLSKQLTGGNTELNESELNESELNSVLNESELFSDESFNGGEALPRCTLYYANWCGHCKVLKPTWQKLVESDKYKGKIQFEEVEADENPAAIQKAQIEGFPTIKIEKNTETKEYQGDRTIEDLEEFLDSNI